jgi:hypothetical protein
MHYVGLDVHARRSSLCILDPLGTVVKRLEVRGSWPRPMDQVASQVPRPFAVCFEASCGYGHLHGRLSALAERVEVAHPGKLRLIFRAKRKNDRVDAEKQAKLLYLDQVPRVHVPAADVRAWRGLIELRRRLVGRPPLQADPTHKRKPSGETRRLALRPTSMFRQPPALNALCGLTSLTSDLPSLAMPRARRRAAD